MYTFQKMKASENSEEAITERTCKRSKIPGFLRED